MNPPSARVHAAAEPPQGGWFRRLSSIGPNVLFLGLTSLLTDVSSEMVNAILPLYLTQFLRFTPLAFGLFDGIYQGSSAVVRIWGGVIADRRGRKPVAALGYAVSAASKVGLAASGTLWAPVTGLLLLDRLGKGVRTAPRDALIALSSPRDRWGEAFGIHRAMDTAGALIGPLCAFALLARAPAAFDAIFAASAGFAAVGLGVLLFFVEDRRGEGRAAAAALSRRAATAVLAAPGFRILMFTGCILSLTTISDAFIYLVVQRRANLDPSWFPLLPAAMVIAYLALSVPAGRLADRIGRHRVFLAGYAALTAAYVLLALPSASPVVLFVSLPLVGAYYASTDGVLMAMASQTLPAERLTAGLALLTTGTTLGRLFASLLFGAAWSRRGPQDAVLLFLCALVAAMVVAALALRERT